MKADAWYRGVIRKELGSGAPYTYVDAITQEGTAEAPNLAGDVFVHRDDAPLKPGTEIRFQLTKTDKGLRATSVELKPSTALAAIQRKQVDHGIKGQIAQRAEEQTAFFSLVEHTVGDDYFPAESRHAIQSGMNTLLQLTGGLAGRSAAVYLFLIAAIERLYRVITMMGTQDMLAQMMDTRTVIDQFSGLQSLGEKFRAHFNLGAEQEATIKAGMVELARILDVAEQQGEDLTQALMGLLDEVVAHRYLDDVTQRPDGELETITLRHLAANWVGWMVSGQGTRQHLMSLHRLLSHPYRELHKGDFPRRLRELILEGHTNTSHQTYAHDRFDSWYASGPRASFAGGFDGQRRRREELLRLNKRLQIPPTPLEVMGMGEYSWREVCQLTYSDRPLFRPRELMDARAYGMGVLILGASALIAQYQPVPRVLLQLLEEFDSQSEGLPAAAMQIIREWVDLSEGKSRVNPDVAADTLLETVAQLPPAESGDGVKRLKEKNTLLLDNKPTPEDKA